MVDFTRPVTTRDGRKVRILCTDMVGTEYPVAGLIMTEKGYEIINQWFANGRHYTNRESVGDLINPPVKKYLALCRNGASGGYYDTHEECERAGRKCKGYIKTIEVEL